MKTSTKTMGIMLMALTGYGAWSLYKKYNSKMMNDMDCMIKSVSKNVEKSLDDMM